MIQHQTKYHFVGCYLWQWRTQTRKDKYDKKNPTKYLTQNDIWLTVIFSVYFKLINTCSSVHISKISTVVEKFLGAWFFSSLWCQIRYWPHHLTFYLERRVPTFCGPFYISIAVQWSCLGKGVKTHHCCRKRKQQQTPR